MRTAQFTNLPARALLVLAVLALTSCTTTRPQVDGTEGLSPVEPAPYRWAWQKPGAGIDNYDRVLLFEPRIEFRENWQRDYNRTQRSLAGRVGDDDIARIKSRLAQATLQAFGKELTDAGLELASQPGPGTLSVYVDLQDVDIHAPDVLTPGRRDVFVESAGEMTLSLTLRDSASGDVLYRAVERREDPRMAWPQRQTSVQNYAAALRILGSWGQALAGLLKPA